MADNHNAVFVNDDGLLPAETLDAVGDVGDLLVIVGLCVFPVRRQLRHLPHYDLHRIPPFRCIPRPRHPEENPAPISNLLARLFEAL